MSNANPTNGSGEGQEWSDERLLLRDIRTLLDQLQLDPDHSLRLDSELTNDLGVDSLALVELCDLFERSFDVTLPDEVFLTARTPLDWLAAIRVARGDPRHYSPAPFKPPTAYATPGAEGARGRIDSVAWKVVRRMKSRPSGASRGTVSRPLDGCVEAAAGSVFYTVYAWTLLIPFGLTLWLLASLPTTLATRSRIGRHVARWLCRALGISLRLEGSLPSTDRPYVIAANHSSFVDGLVLYVMSDEQLVFVSSIELERTIFLGRILKGYGCLFVERGRAERSAASVEKLVRAVKSGRRLAVFPEGSISTGTGIRMFHLGVFETATSSQCPVVPVGIRGTREILPAGSYRPHRGEVRVIIGSPIPPDGTDFTARVALRDAVRDAIATLSDESAIGSS